MKTATPVIRRIRATMLGLFAAVLVLSAFPGVAGAQGSAIVVADVRGPLEQRAIDFLTAAVESDDAVVVILQLNNPGIASGDPTALYEAIENAASPVAAWIGPSGAEAYGGVAEILAYVDHVGAAPGVQVGYMGQRMAGGPVTGLPDGVPDLFNGKVLVGEPIEGVIDEIVPTIGQYIATLDGQTFATGAGDVDLITVEATTDADGNQVLVAAHDVRFEKPGLIARALRLAMRPEAMFFFLIAGLTSAVFEFFAAGGGIAASVSVLSLFFAGFGLASLPMNWLGFALVMLGMWLYTVEFQNATISWRGLVGTALLLWGGLTITSGGPQFGSRWWAIVLAIIGVASFYMVALTTVARSRFSTVTIGRDYLVGKVGVAETGFDPMGVVEVDGARWQARSHRAAGLSAGDAIEVLEVKGIMLEVGPPETAENSSQN